LLLTKAILHPQNVLEEIKHPFIGSFYPTIAMTLMVVSTYIVQYSKPVAQFVWLFGLLLHILLDTMFFIARTKDFKFEDVVPSWYVLTVGLGVGAVTGRPIGFIALSKVTFYYAFIWYLILLPVMLYRVFKIKNIPKAKETSLMIIGAPANICLAGYLGVFDVKSPSLINFILILAVLNMAYDYYILPRLLRLKFSPALAPLTFPLCIGAVAMQRYYNYLVELNSKWTGFVREVYFIQLLVATLITGYIVYKLCENFLFNLKNHLINNEL
ncbi:MAG: TDT family transporter, partial [Paraclostridium sp.]